MKTAETKSSTSANQRATTDATAFFEQEGSAGQLLDMGGELSTFPVQARLKIGSPDDRFEQEADATADTVVQRLAVQGATTSGDGHASRVPALSVNRFNVPLRAKQAGPEEQLQRQTEEEEQPIQEQVQRKPIFESAADPPEEEGTVQRQADTGEASGAPADFSSQLRNASGGGSPLPGDTRTEMEGAFGADFSNVRIHTGSNAANLSDSIQAQAFTHGNDIYFNEGKFNPGSTDGKHLLAHELTHTVQQGASVQRREEEIETTGDTRIQQKPVISQTSNNVQAVGNPVRSVLNRIAKNIPGWKLFTTIIGYNPILKEDVPRTAETLIGGFLGLLGPVGNALFARLKETKAIPTAMAWLEKEVTALNFSLAYFNTLTDRALEVVSVWTPIDNLRKASAIFAEPWQRVKRFLGRLGHKIKEFVFRGALKLVGAPVERVMGILSQAGGVLTSIFNNPIGFLGNLVKAIKAGLGRFVQNIGTHLLNGLVDWLFGALSKAGIQLPQKWDLPGIFSLVMQVLNLTYGAIRAKVVKVIGEPAVARLEQVFSFVKDLIVRGPIVLWERVQEFLGNLQEMVMGGIRSFVTSRLVKAGVTKLLTMFNPAGALIQAVLAIWNTIKFFIDKAQQIGSFVKAVFSSIGRIAAGNVAEAAEWIEKSLARAIPVLLSFLARFIGLGNISAQIRGVIQRIRQPIDKALGKVVGWLAAQARRLLGRGKGQGEAADSKLNIVKQSILKQGKDKGKDGEVSKGDVDAITSNIQQNHKSVLSSVRVTDNGSSWNFEYIQRAKAKKGGGSVEVAKSMESVKLLNDVLHIQGKRFKVGDEIAYAKGKGWRRGPHIITAFSKSTVRGEEFIMLNVHSQHTNEHVKISAIGFPTTWRAPIEALQELPEDQLQSLNAEETWTSFEIAKKVLNYRAHGIQHKNPAGKDWEHIVENQAGGRHSSGNLALLDSGENSRLNAIYQSKAGNRGITLEGVPAQMTLRDFLAGKSKEVMYEWKNKIYEKIKLKLKWKNKKRGKFQVLEKN
ncbi:MAG: DUF4157 domain-containing protein [Bacteroidota bacterium]